VIRVRTNRTSSGNTLVIKDSDIQGGEANKNYPKYMITSALLSFDPIMVDAVVW
jgi:hypothetical protein